jgi:hypothetical protein
MQNYSSFGAGNEGTFSIDIVDGTSFNILYNIFEYYLCNIRKFRTRLGRFLVNSIGGTLDQFSKRIREVSQFK